MLKIYGIQVGSIKIDRMQFQDWMENFREIRNFIRSIKKMYIYIYDSPFFYYSRRNIEWSRHGREKVSFEHSESSFYRWQQRHSIVDQNNTKREVFLSKRVGQYIFFSFNSYGPCSSQRSTEVNKEFEQKGQAFFNDSTRFYRTQFFNSSR